MFIVLFGLAGAYSLTLRIPSAIASVLILSVGLVTSMIYFAKSQHGTQRQQIHMKNVDVPLVLFILLFIVLIYLLGF